MLNVSMSVPAIQSTTHTTNQATEGNSQVSLSSGIIAANNYMTRDIHKRHDHLPTTAKYTATGLRVSQPEDDEEILSEDHE